MKFKILLDKELPTTVASPVTAEDMTDSFRADIQEMADFLRGNAKAAALAAPQVGINKAFFVINPSMVKKFRGMIDSIIFNPKVSPWAPKKLLQEGCLSFPNLYIPVPRHGKVNLTYDYFNTETKAMESRAVVVSDEFLAQIVQHETDHLNGITFINRAKGE